MEVSDRLIRCKNCEKSGRLLIREDINDMPVLTLPQGWDIFLPKEGNEILFFCDEECKASYGSNIASGLEHNILDFGEVGN